MAVSVDKCCEPYDYTCYLAAPSKKVISVDYRLAKLSAILLLASKIIYLVGMIGAFRNGGTPRQNCMHLWAH